MGKLLIVTGAPGSGKSAIVEELLKTEHDFVMFDIDWLAPSASELAGANVYFARAIWKPYRAMWVDILRMVQKNHRQPVLFASIDKDDVAELGHEVAADVSWCLLDCNEAERRKRLHDRQKWSDAMVKEALDAAAKLRDQIPSPVIDTSTATL